MLPQARTENLLVQEVGEELVVYDQVRHRAHRLNATAAEVWRHCDGATNVADLASLLARKFDLPPDQDLIWLALDRLETARLLRTPVYWPATEPVSRRSVMQKIGVAGTLAFLLPVITSITAPTPAMSQSACAAPCHW